MIGYRGRYCNMEVKEKYNKQEIVEQFRDFVNDLSDNKESFYFKSLIDCYKSIEIINNISINFIQRIADILVTVENINKPDSAMIVKDKYYNDKINFSSYEKYEENVIDLLEVKKDDNINSIELVKFIGEEEIGKKQIALVIKCYNEYDGIIYELHSNYLNERVLKVDHDDIEYDFNNIYDLEKEMLNRLSVNLSETGRTIEDITVGRSTKW